MGCYMLNEVMRVQLADVDDYNQLVSEEFQIISCVISNPDDRQNFSCQNREKVSYYWCSKDSAQEYGALNTKEIKSNKKQLLNNVSYYCIDVWTFTYRGLG